MVEILDESGGVKVGWVVLVALSSCLCTYVCVVNYENISTLCSKIFNTCKNFKDCCMDVKDVCGRCILWLYICLTNPQTDEF